MHNISWNSCLLYKAVQELHVLAIADVFANHLFVQSGVFSEPLGHLVVVHRVTEEASILQELDSLLGLLVKLFCACDQQLDTWQKGHFKVAVDFRTQCRCAILQHIYINPFPFTFFLVLISINSWESGKHDEKRWGFFGAFFSAGWKNENIHISFNWLLPSQGLGRLYSKTVCKVSPESLSPLSCRPSLILSAIRCPLVGGHTGAFSASGLRPLVLPSPLRSEDKKTICSVQTE